MLKKLFFLSLILVQAFLGAECVHKSVQLNGDDLSFEWEGSAAPFNEMIISWNGSRPSFGSWKISYALFENGWSDWTPHLEWGAEGQTSLTPGQDTVNAALSTGFRVCVEAEGGADLKNLRALHVYTGNTNKYPFDPDFILDKAVSLNVPKMSQVALNSPISLRICSPTSSCAACAFLSPNAMKTPLDFASKVYDLGYDIYGNWALNVAEAANQIGAPFEAWVERGDSLQAVVDSLLNGFPVVVSVRGPLSGSAMPYAQGHLMIIRGIDPVHRKVLVMDPAFPTDEETYAAYDLDDFMAAWARRGFPSYRFRKS